MPLSEPNWRAWVAKAEHDMLCIRNNMAAEETPWDIVSYHAQQAAEKMLKALLVFHGTQPRRTHDLVALLGECMRVDAKLSELSADAELLTAYAIEVRYPGDLLELGQAEAIAAVEAGERIRASIACRLGT